jgi:hypothetical protein
VRGVEELEGIFYRVEGKGGGAVEAVAELGRCAINGGGGGSVEWRGGAVSGRGKAGRRRSGWRRRLHGVVEEAEGRGEAGDDGTAGGRRGEERGGRRPEVEEA